MFAAQTFGVTPDLLCLGKGSPADTHRSRPCCAGSTSPRPSGAIRIEPRVRRGTHIRRQPDLLAAGLATLSEILERDLCASPHPGRTSQGRVRVTQKHGIIGDIRGKGLMQCIELVKDPETKEQFDPPIGQAIGKRALENGLISRFDPHWIALGPPLTVTGEQIDEMVAILDQSITDVLNGSV
ncbi:MAG: hypothetical protein CM1200mP2_22170 [Planctomycetaceae bacterium]|nr:MAG: hypothetical protein CM1200mP2_22170 [Planctomycetaceae bacterium]